MSHSGALNGGSGGGGPVSTLTGNTGGAVGPDGASNINVIGSGAITVTGNAGTHTLTITDQLVQIGTATTVGATTATLITIPLAASQSVMIQCILTAYESTTPTAFGGQIIGAVFRAGAAAAAVLPNPDPFSSEGGAIPNATMNISASGNNALVTVTGQAGLTLNWRGAAFFITQP
jgi:hypothetical protein